MKIKIRHLALLLVAVTALHFFAIFTGMYEGSRIWIDKPQHIIAGAFFALLGFLLFQKKLGELNGFARGFAAISFALMGGFLWELLEFSFISLLPEYAMALKMYSPVVKDALFDIGFGVLGGIIIIFIMNRRTV